MLRVSPILVRTLALAASAAILPGCGQRGPLYLPATPAQTLASGSDADAAKAPTSAAPGR
ncbi:LPS translocon maturation chaperone LptM [Verminephrobacter aporrectodeae]|uniref:Lipoprotein-attachment site-containing protein n=1 Tax=Verminephrobacter aporrectodeae subsp. tuberculatae TaxID=1110392 RepID=A0ABT3KU33_9BURK|nr:lipoprotein [Verminephrobacter aporrectodeae]MCW5222824.1 hypothetical protein [Verminephrobacter aporrectodeae subsp. tuberculatae]MCW5256948.1 hypothetical protein [Verminephrobacter aporrectodeae subsp. tuberculatae]MCW5288288.1 hypothetical protein [Verminephrobacter aporrectodeae subsp. tuberculatae]MCW5321840.1 hypothetical protein [Verminephrobacter aporrectodeae subsp. tuberculatae]MCW8163421.1 hypothetical protein [Verminephrobacter aporrectodeae subsp. tuberculatae]